MGYCEINDCLFLDHVTSHISQILIVSRVSVFYLYYWKRSICDTMECFTGVWCNNNEYMGIHKCNKKTLSDLNVHV